jgi:hypothetical protein
MRRRSFAWLTVIPFVVAACAAAPAPTPTPAPTPSEPAADACEQDLPLQTSSAGFPFGVLYVNGDDLTPVVGELEWLGGDRPVTYKPPRAVNLERFTVLQAQGPVEVSLRMTDGVELSAWTIDAVPDGKFRSGDLESERERWSEGDEATTVVCVPVRDGHWAVIADVTFADDAGHGTFYWRLNISATPGS